MDRQGDAERSHYSVAKGVVHYLSDGVSNQWTYGQLVETALAFVDFSKIDPNTYLTPIDAFQIIGQPLPRPDIPLKVNGSAKFGIDIMLPGMVFAAIKHCPTIGGTLGITPAKPSSALALVPCKALDNRGAIVKDSINAVAIVASDTWTAMKLAKGLSVNWKLPVSTATVDSASILAKATTLMSTSPTSTTPLWLAESRDASGPVTAPISNLITTNAAAIVSTETSVNEAINAFGKTLQATFSLPYLAHVTMEVMNCTVSFIFSGTTPTKCEIWAPSQNPVAVQTTAFNYLTAMGTPLTKDQIVVHTTFLGGGLGRKIEQDYIYQALQVALAVKKPVKLTWSREEDSAHDLYRPMALINVKAGLTDSNDIAGCSYRVVTPSISWQRSGIKTSLDLQAVEGAVQSLYNMGSSLTEWVPMDKIQLRSQSASGVQLEPL
jgi:isoquinoline 1-oxidoreductase beta subunit